MDTQKELLKDRIAEEVPKWHRLESEVAKQVIGLEPHIRRLSVALIADGHILLEGVPGVAKTTLVKAFAEALGLGFSRIQFTPDLLPSDLLGTMIFNPSTNTFSVKKGPVFANIVLADEINRAPPKVQSALLEAMQERQVTIGDKTFSLESPFLVLATQNPVEQEGTYKLPEAQVDRFLLKLKVSYLTLEDEKKVLQLKLKSDEISRVISRDEISVARDLVRDVYIDDKIVDYILKIVFATREPDRFGLKDMKRLIDYGASPRASIALHLASRINAFLSGRHFVVPDDVKELALEVLRHRIILSYEAEAEGISSDEIVQEILRKIPTP